MAPGGTGRAVVELREFEAGDAPAVHRWFNDERVTESLVARRGEFDLDAAHGWVERAREPGDDRKWAIAIDGERRAVGFVALFGIARPVGPELAVLVGEPDAWGRGVAREAERQACRVAFEELGVHRLNAEIPATNVAAQRVVTHLGFVREGVMRRALRRPEGTIDNELWGLLAEEFTGRDRPSD